MTEGAKSNISGAKKKKGFVVATRCLFIALMVFILGVLISVVVTKAKGGTPNIFGLYILKVQTSSMDPTLKEGDTIVAVRPRDSASLSNGQIITFKRNGVSVTHRIVGYFKDSGGETAGYLTKGDNVICSVDDGYVKFQDIIAVFVFKLF